MELLIYLAAIAMVIAIIVILRWIIEKMVQLFITLFIVVIVIACIATGVQWAKEKTVDMKDNVVAYVESTFH